MIFYHGTNKKFDKLEIEHGLDEFIYASPCKNNSLGYVPKVGGYLYTLEIDVSNTNYHLSKEYGNKDCLCRAYSDVSKGITIVDVERIDHNDVPVRVRDCGSISMRIQRNL